MFKNGDAAVQSPSLIMMGEILSQYINTES